MRDGHLVTANDSAALEFREEVLLALKAFPAAEIEQVYRFYKEGHSQKIKKKIPVSKGSFMGITIERDQPYLMNRRKNDEYI